LPYRYKKSKYEEKIAQRREDYQVTFATFNSCRKNDLSVTAMGDALGAGAVLTGIERQLTQAAEMRLTGRLSDELYLSLVRGALALLPMLETPKHIVVLKALKVWREDELLPVQVHEQLQVTVIAASHPATAGEAAAAAATTQPPLAAAVASGKKRAREPGQLSILGRREAADIKDGVACAARGRRP
jgi:hypothetical protein